MGQLSKCVSTTVEQLGQNYWQTDSENDSGNQLT